MTSSRASGKAQRGRTGNPGRDPVKLRGEDLYETPPEAVRALLTLERLPPCIWEPAAGRGAIVNVLRSAGHTVLGTDLVDYGAKFGVFAGRDFLMELCSPFGCECIVTNPPYKMADEFVRHAIKLVPKVCMLLRLAYLEGIERSDLIDGALARVWVFRNRLPRMHREGWTGPKATSTIAFAWFVFEAHDGPVKLSRITWR